jgi:hypothetical protein
MATRNIVPNENNEGSLGTDPKRWASVHATELKQAGNDVLDVSDLASDAEAEAGTDNTKVMTPLRTAQAIAALGLDGMGVPFDLENFGEGVTLSVADGTLQRGVMVADTTISISGSGNPEGKQLVLSFWTNGGAHALDFSGIQMSPEASALLPITLENSRSYVLKFGRVGWLWTLQEIYGPTLVD